MPRLDPTTHDKIEAHFADRRARYALRPRYEAGVRTFLASAQALLLPSRHEAAPDPAEFDALLARFRELWLARHAVFQTDELTEGEFLLMEYLARARADWMQRQQEQC